MINFVILSLFVISNSNSLINKVKTIKFKKNETEKFLLVKYEFENNAFHLFFNVNDIN